MNIDEKIEKHLNEKIEKGSPSEEKARKYFLREWKKVNKYVKNINKFVITKKSWGFLENAFDVLERRINDLKPYIEDVYEDKIGASGFDSGPSNAFRGEQDAQDDWDNR